MRIPITILAGAAALLTPVAAFAQTDNAAANAVENTPAPDADVNLAVVPPAEDGMLADPAAPAAADTAVVDDPYAAPEATPRRQRMPWGLLGLLGLVGLLGRRRSAGS